jgi:hypothetical protein
MPFGRRDPGPCPVCGAAHSACTTDSGPVTIVQLPARDAARELAPPPLVAEIVQETLPTGQVTTGTYRRGKKTP